MSTEPAAAEVLTVTQVLRNRNFRVQWAAGVVRGIGAGATGLAVMLLLVSWSDNPGIIAVYAIASALPYVLVAPIAGVVVDRVNRLHVLLVGQPTQALLVLGLLLTSADRVWLAAVLIFVQFCVATFTGPASDAIFAAMVPDHGRSAGAGLLSSSGFVTRLAGAGITSLLFAVGHVPVAFVLDACMLGISVLMLARLRRVHGLNPRADTGDRSRFRDDLRTGARFISKTPAVRWLLTGVAAAVLVTAAVNVLYVPLAVNTLEANGAWLFTIEAALLVGVVCAGLLAGHLSRLMTDWTTWRLALLAWGVLTTGYALIGNLWTLAAMHMLFGFVGMRVSTTTQVLILRITPAHQLGRVQTVFNSADRGMYIATTAVVGGLVGAIGTSHIFVLMGAVATFCAIVAAIGVRAVSAPRSGQDHASEPPGARNES